MTLVIMELRISLNYLNIVLNFKDCTLTVPAHSYTHMHSHTHIYTHTLTHMHMLTHAHIRTCVHVCIHTQTDNHACTHTKTSTHAHNHFFFHSPYTLRTCSLSRNYIGDNGTKSLNVGLKQCTKLQKVQYVLQTSA